MNGSQQLSLPMNFKTKPFGLLYYARPKQTRVQSFKNLGSYLFDVRLFNLSWDFEALVRNHVELFSRYARLNSLVPILNTRDYTLSLAPVYTLFLRGAISLALLMPQSKKSLAVFFALDFSILLELVKLLIDKTQLLFFPKYFQSPLCWIPFINTTRAVPEQQFSIQSLVSMNYLR